MIRAIALLTGLAFASSAAASAVAGCRYTGEVAALSTAKKVTAVELRVQTSEAFGHSGPPAMCAAVGETVTVSMKAKDLRKLAVASGVLVSAEVTDVFNPPDHVRDERITAVLPRPE